MSTLKIIKIISWSTFRQGLRSRLFFLALTAVCAVFLLGNVFRNFSDKANLELRLILETGLALSALVVLGTALLLSCRGVGHGDERASHQALFALPISRDGVYWGHLTGICFTLATFTMAMAFAMIAVVAWRFGHWRWSLLVHFLTLFVEGVLLAAISSLIALSRSTIVAFFSSMAIAIIAHAESVVLHLSRESGHMLLEGVVTVAVKLMPALGALDVKAVAVRDLPIPWIRLSGALGHSAVYLLVILLLSSYVRKRVEGA